jgi:hypothetical protein
MTALLLIAAACSGDSNSAVEAPAAQTEQAPVEQAPVEQSATPVSPPADTTTDDAAATADPPAEEPAGFEACSTEQRQALPIAADVSDLGSRWSAAAAAVDPGELTPFEIPAAFSVTDENQMPDGGGNYVGDRAFLSGMSQTDSAIDAAQLILAPDSPVASSAVQAFVMMVVGPDAPDGAVDQVIDSLTLWRSDSTISESVVYNCYWQAARQPLTTDEDDFVLTLSVSAAETTQYGNGDIGRWLRSRATRTSTTLFVRDAQRWSGQSDS